MKIAVTLSCLLYFTATMYPQLLKELKTYYHSVFHVPI